ncbi:MAG: hypothetical protein NTY76_07870 [Candidatus Omnitrophica bacterium]|nr:hypothetical protein [Candidatus Omnitrophota bacterium]
MERLKKIVAILIIICFGLNNVSYAFEINAFKLAVPSSFSNFKDQGFKEAAQIQIGMRMALKDLASLDLSSLNALGKRQFAEKTIFTRKISGTMYFDEAQACKPNDQKLYAESGSYLVKAQTASGITYYCFISNKRNEKGYDVSVVPEKVLAEALRNDYAAKGTKKKSMFRGGISIVIAGALMIGAYSYFHGESNKDALSEVMNAINEWHKYEYAAPATYQDNLVKIAREKIIERLVSALGEYRHNKRFGDYFEDDSGLQEDKETFDCTVPEIAANAFGEIGKPAVPKLIKALNEKVVKKSDFKRREYVAKALGMTGDAEVVEPLIQTLKQLADSGCGASDYKHNKSVFDGLVRVGKPAVPALIEVLNDNTRDPKKTLETHRGPLCSYECFNRAKFAAEALGVIGDGRAVEPLIQALKRLSNVYWVDTISANHNIVIALGRLGDKRAIEPLMVHMKNNEWNPSRVKIVKKAIERIEKRQGGTSAPETSSQGLAMAGSVVLGLVGKPREKYAKPANEDIRLIASRIKEAGIEVFIPKSQFLGDTIAKYRGVVESIGGKLRVYQNIEALQGMVEYPAKSIIMTAGISEGDMALLQSLKASMGQLRFMNFAKMEDLSTMSVEEVDNYQADILSILLIARIITPEDFQDKGSPTYRMLAHLLEDYMPEGVAVENYIQDIVTNAARLVKTILKALPVAAYKVMRQSVEVLWAA